MLILKSESSGLERKPGLAKSAMFPQRNLMRQRLDSRKKPNFDLGFVFFLCLEPLKKQMNIILEIFMSTIPSNIGVSFSFDRIGKKGIN